MCSISCSKLDLSMGWVDRLKTKPTGFSISPCQYYETYPSPAEIYKSTKNTK